MKLTSQFLLLLLFFFATFAYGTEPAPCPNVQDGDYTCAYKQTTTEDGKTETIDRTASIYMYVNQENPIRPNAFKALYYEVSLDEPAQYATPLLCANGGGEGEPRGILESKYKSEGTSMSGNYFYRPNHPCEDPFLTFATGRMYSLTVKTKNSFTYTGTEKRKGQDCYGKPFETNMQEYFDCVYSKPHKN